MKSYEWVKSAVNCKMDDTGKLFSEVKMTGDVNLHNTRQDLLDAGWIDDENSLYLLPSGYIYSYNGNFVLKNPEFNLKIEKKEHYYW